MSKFLHLSLGLERIIFFLLVFIMLTHISACLWLIVPRFYNDDPKDLTGTWLSDFATLSN